MLTPVQNITRVIEEKRRALAAAEQEAAYLKRELATLTSLLNGTADASSISAPPPPARAINAAPKRSPRPRRNNGGAPRRGRELTPQWAAVLGRISAAVGGATINEIIAFAGECGVTATSPAIRSQVAGYCKRGRLSKSNAGQYTVVVPTG
jgi:hypothetical protein